MGAVTGTPYRILYETPTNLSGLTDAVAFVVTPELAVEGPFELTEMPGVFAGCYFFDYFTADNALAGEYFVKCYSPTIGKLGRALRVSFSSAGGGDSSDIEQLLALLSQIVPMNIVARVDDAAIRWSLQDEPQLHFRLDSDVIYASVLD